MVETKVETVLKETGLSWLTLFAAGGTLICCALPIILVTLGLGATVAAFTSSFPLLITIAQHKGWVFAGSAALLLLSGWLVTGTRRNAVMKVSDRGCLRVDRGNQGILLSDTIDHGAFVSSNGTVNMLR